MNRLIIELHGSVAPDGSPYLAIALEEPFVQNTKDRPFPCKVDDAEFAALKAAVLQNDSVKQAGGRLFQAVTSHPEIQQYLQTALQAHDRYPIFVEIKTDEGAEALPWEALCSPTGDFLGLDARWSLARMVQPEVPVSAAPFYKLTPPLRIAAVLSCLNISAAGELAALREAIQAAGDGQVKLLVIASEEKLVVDLQAEMAAGTAPEIQAVTLMPSDLDSLQAMVSAFGPQVLHFFCHGSVETSPHIRLALKSDWEAANPTSGLLAEAGDFSGFTGSTDDLPWLVVLNCCEGAAVGNAPDAQSLVLSLAVAGVAPAVLGMREPVVSNTANLVTSALYKSLLADVMARVGAPGQEPQPLDWPHLVVAARDRLARTHDGMVLSQAAASTKEWTLPVVYVRPNPFNLLVAPPEQPPPVAPPGEPPGQPPGQPPGGPPGPLPPAHLPGPTLAPPPPVDEDVAARAARLEIETLQALLTALPPDQAAGLKGEASARIAQLAAQLGVQLPTPVAAGPAAVPV